MSLRERRCRFSVNLAHLVAWVAEYGATQDPKWEICFDEVKVAFRRRVLVDGVKREAHDAVHIYGSKHYDGLAADLNLYVGGVYITDSGHPAWLMIGERWEAMDPENTWGGRFADVDGNHVSYQER